jgi:hypothetical protein
MVKLIAICSFIGLVIAFAAWQWLTGNGGVLEIAVAVLGLLGLFFIDANVRGWVGHSTKMRRAFDEGRCADAETLLRHAWERGAEPVGKLAHGLSLTL